MRFGLMVFPSKEPVKQSCGETILVLDFEKMKKIEREFKTNPTQFKFSSFRSSICRKSFFASYLDYCWFSTVHVCIIWSTDRKVSMTTTDHDNFQGIQTEIVESNGQIYDLSIRLINHPRNSSWH